MVICSEAALSTAIAAAVPVSSLALCCHFHVYCSSASGTGIPVSHFPHGMLQNGNERGVLLSFGRLAKRQIVPQTALSRHHTVCLTLAPGSVHYMCMSFEIQITGCRIFHGREWEFDTKIRRERE